MLQTSFKERSIKGLYICIYIYLVYGSFIDNNTVSGFLIAKAVKLPITAYYIHCIRTWMDSCLISSQTTSHYFKIITSVRRELILYILDLSGELEDKQPTQCLDNCFVY